LPQQSCSSSPPTRRSALRALPHGRARCSTPRHSTEPCWLLRASGGWLKVLGLRLDRRWAAASLVGAHVLSYAPRLLTSVDPLATLTEPDLVYLGGLPNPP